MNTFRKLVLALTFGLLLGIPSISYAQATPPPPPQTWSATVEIKLSLNILEYTGKDHHPIRGWFPIAEGSGTIIDGDRGLVLTNNHVIDMSFRKILGQYPMITVIFQPTASNFRLVYAGIVLGRDKPTDVAILKLFNPLNPGRITGMGLPQVTLGDSASLNIGDNIIVIGNPFGVGKSVSGGLISALNRGEGTREEVIQTDAAMNPGNSGGGVFDVHGNLVGIPVQIASSHSSGGQSAGVGFFLPINIVVNEIGQLIINHQIVHAQLGAHIFTPPALYLANGIVISDIEPHSAAAKAGLQPGDIILKLGTTPMFIPEDVIDYLTYARPNDQVVVTIDRAGKELSLVVTLSTAPVDNSVGQDDSAGN